MPLLRLELSREISEAVKSRETTTNGNYPGIFPQLVLSAVTGLGGIDELCVMLRLLSSVLAQKLDRTCNHVHDAPRT